MQTEVQKQSRFGKKFWLKAVGILILISFIYNIGASGAKVELEDEKANYDELVAAIKEKESKLDETQKKLDDIDVQYKEKESEFTEALKVVENKKAVEGEITELNKQIDSKNSEIGTLDETIKKKNTELASVEGKIKEKKDAPKVLSAGFFTVGKDIPASRYKVVPNGGSGNFFVNDGMKVNIILGNGGFGEKEYVFEAEEGDVIELTTSAKFIAVE